MGQYNFSFSQPLCSYVSIVFLLCMVHAAGVKLLFQFREEVKSAREHEAQRIVSDKYLGNVYFTFQFKSAEFVEHLDISRAIETGHFIIYIFWICGQLV